MASESSHESVLNHEYNIHTLASFCGGSLPFDSYSKLLLFKYLLIFSNMMKINLQQMSSVVTEDSIQYLLTPMEAFLLDLAGAE